MIGWRLRETPPDPEKTAQRKEKARAKLIRAIEIEARETARATGRATLASAVLAAMAEVPREAFGPFADVKAAYANAPYPIGHGQTISQPFIVALMTDLLNPLPHKVMLEVGTGSGYQAAVLSRLVRRVYSVEVVPELAASAQQHLQDLGYDNVEVHVGDGAAGWPEHAPYDGIIVTAAAPSPSPRLVEQLAPRGRMVLPLGEPFAPQELVVIEKDDDGNVSHKTVLPVAFVPLIGDR